MSALFSGTVYYAQVTFKTSGGTYSVSDADMQTILQYAGHAIVPISEWLKRYGPSSVKISPTALAYSVDLTNSSFDPVGWVNDIAATNALSTSSSCVVILLPQQIRALVSEVVSADGGYHALANVPFAIVGIDIQNLTLNDDADGYAMGISHELAEMIADPQAEYTNPEVCDPCDIDCQSQHFYRAYFDSSDQYLGTNQQTPPGGFNYAYFTAVVVKPEGASNAGGDCHASAGDCDYPPVPRNFYFVSDKNSFGSDEVADAKIYPSAFWLVLEGFSPNSLAGSLPQLSGAFNNSNIPGLTLTQSSVSYDIGNAGTNGDLPQRIRFGYDVQFSPVSLTVFPPPDSPPDTYPLSATIAIEGQTLDLTPSMDFELLAGADPYFSNVDPNTGNYFYFSRDLRIFTATPAVNSTPVPGPGAPLFTADSGDGAFAYIQNLIVYLNHQIGYQNPTYVPPTTYDPLDDLLPSQSGALQGDSSVTPTSGSGANNYNFAIARVRLRGASGPAAAAQNVKVFFRLFATQTSDTDFVDSATAVTTAEPNITYLSDSQGNPANPLPGTSANGEINGCTIPMFATGNYGGMPVDYAAGGINNQTIEVPSGTDYTWAFFGCFLNVYDATNVIGGQTIQHWLAGGTHHCMVAQIAYFGAPIRNENGIVENPAICDKLAQRNLVIAPSGNPGYPATHRVPQTFDVRPSSPPIAGSKSPLASYPDELMIDWGATPAGSVARIYWPSLNAADVLQLASSLYSSHLLSMADANTIQCKVGGGTTYVPIPRGSGQGFAGLFTVDLPNGISVGQQFTVLVRRITTKQIETTSKINSADSLAAPPRSVANNDSLWRYVSGCFAITIPVQHERTILPGDENLLSILKWRLSLLPASYRWRPILVRYIECLSARIDGMGGNSSNIPPSPTGYHGQHGCECVLREGISYRGKVSGVAYDRFGDFEGFLLETETCEIRRICSRERKIEAIVRQAWRDRSGLLVTVRCDDPCCLLSIMLNLPPELPDR